MSRLPKMKPDEHGKPFDCAGRRSGGIAARFAASVHAMEKKMYKHILIPTDGTELSKKAIDQGLALAKAVNARSHHSDGIAALQYSCHGTRYHHRDAGRL
jgi:hypothetical protein